MSRTNIHYALLMFIGIIALASYFVYYTTTQARGVLTVKTYPPGASFYLDGKKAGTTPGTLEDVPLGMRTIAVQKDGYESESYRFNFEPHSQRHIETYLSRTDITTGPDFHAMWVAPRGAIPYGNHFYISLTNGTIYSIERERKDVVWEQELEGQTLLIQPIITEDYVFVLSFQNNLYALHRQDGRIVWEQEIPGWGQTIIKTQEGILLCFGDDSFMLYDETGETQWRTSIGTDVNRYSLQAYDNRVVGATENGQIFQLDLVSGEFTFLAELDLTRIDYSHHGPGILLLADRRGNAAFYDVDSQEGHTLEISNGDPHWVYSLSSQILLLGRGNGLLQAVDPESKELLWEQQMLAIITCAALYENYLYIGTRNGEVFILDSDSGEVQGMRSLTGQIASITPEDHTSLHVMTRGGYLTTMNLPEELWQDIENE